LEIKKGLGESGFLMIVVGVVGLVGVLVLRRRRR